MAQANQIQRVALITGAGTGIGKHSAYALLADGYHVVFSGRREAVLRDAIDASPAPDRCVCIPSDVSDPDSVVSLFNRIQQAFGRLDVLFNNAGTGAPPVPLEQLTLAQWRRVVDINLTGTFLCTQEAIRMMKAQQPQGGRIINNGSISADRPRPHSAPYTATKHAVTGLTKSTALDGRRYNIVCGQIDIGNAATEMTARMSQGVPQADGSLQPEPTMDVAHVAAAVLYMANLPLSANVQFMTIMASAMPYIGRG